MTDHDIIGAYKRGLIERDNRILARAITLIESRRETDQKLKSQLLQSIQNIRKPSVKIGITGSPGVGKSTFLNTFVSLFRGTSSRIAILTIDPSSNETGGSILGDKLRMKDLLNNEHVYIRPSPSKGTLGGITMTTWETIHLCEAAGFDYIFIETVGVGQSEIDVQYLTNEVWYLTMASSGDEIQGVKRGVLEVADRIIVTKRDLNAEGTRKTKAFLQQTMQPSGGIERNITFYEISALDPESMNGLHSDSAEIQANFFTEAQTKYWFNRGWQENVIQFMEGHPTYKKLYMEIKKEVDAQHLNHWTAMAKLNKELKEIWG